MNTLDHLLTLTIETRETQAKILAKLEEHGASLAELRELEESCPARQRESVLDAYDEMTLRRAAVRVARWQWVGVVSLLASAGWTVLTYLFNN
jgi:hypothetical protein